MYLIASPVHEIISRQLCSALADVINASSSSYNNAAARFSNDRKIDLIVSAS